MVNKEKRNKVKEDEEKIKQSIEKFKIMREN
jgi:hypothetical protein